MKLCIGIATFLLVSTMLICTFCNATAEKKPELVTIIGINALQAGDYTVDYLVDTEFRTAYFANAELVDRFILLLESKAKVTWLGEAQ
jgi:hypothetical protein